MLNSMYGIEVKLKSNFLVIKETLERIGIANSQTKIITPSCYILHKQNRYFIIHFKELLAFDGFQNNVTDTDLERRNAIITLLVNWNMVEIADPDIFSDDIYQEELKQQIFVLPFSEKDQYKINHKYKIRKR